MSDVPDRIGEVMELVARAQELLDQAVGRSARLTGLNKELVRQHLLEPRNHLRNSAHALRRKLDTEDARAQEKRRAS